MSNCTDCLLDLTDACPRGAGRAIDDEICDSFFPRETYEVNKNESWQLGYKQGIEKIHDFVSWLQITKKVDMSVWKMLDDYADEYLAEPKP